MMIGTFTSDGEARFPENGEAGIRAFEELIGRKLAQVLWFTAFKPLYDKLVALADKPIAIPEMASGEFTYGQITKADWIIHTFSRMKSCPALKMFSWFNINKELDWRVNSTPAVLAAFRKMMSDPHFESEYEDTRPAVAR